MIGGTRMLKKGLFIILALWLAAPAVAMEKEVSALKTGRGEQKDTLTGMEFVHVGGGCFRMGSDSGNSNEKPAHEACISDFFIGKHEITQGQWRKIMNSNPSRFSRCGDDCPVEQVTWSDTQAFIQKLNSLTGKKFRLPTETEWEYACKSGGKDQIYCGGNDLDALAWHEGNSEDRTHPVGRKKPNGLGIFDMSGNVWEWVQDYWKGDYFGVRQQDPTGPLWSTNSVRRGGSWQYGLNQSRAAWRSNGYSDDYAPDLGFRLALSAVK